jgi:hypothetical protein
MVIQGVAFGHLFMTICGVDQAQKGYPQGTARRIMALA